MRVEQPPILFLVENRKMKNFISNKFHSRDFELKEKMNPSNSYRDPFDSSWDGDSIGPMSFETESEVLSDGSGRLINEENYVPFGHRPDRSEPIWIRPRTSSIRQPRPFETRVQIDLGNFPEPQNMRRSLSLPIMNGPNQFRPIRNLNDEVENGQSNEKTNKWSDQLLTCLVIILIVVLTTLLTKLRLD